MGNWLPKSVLSFKSYTRRMFVSDLLAGVTVGIVALPPAMAFAIASGVPPQAGLSLFGVDIEDRIGIQDSIRPERASRPKACS